MKFSSFLKKHFILLLLVASATVLRFYHLDYQSLWDDEIATMIETNPELSFSEFYEVHVNYDNMPPLYFIVLRALFSVFGHSSLVLRMFSALTGVVSVYGIYLLGTVLAGRRTGLIAAFLLCFNAMHIHYSQEGRPYSFFICFTILSFYALVKFLKDPRRKNLIHYIIFATLMLYGQYFGLIILSSQCLLLLYGLITITKAERIRYLIYSVVAGLIIALCYFPAFPQLFKSLGFKTSWIPSPGPEIFTDIFNDIFGRSELLLPVIYVTLIAFFVSLFKEQNDDLGKWNQALKPLQFSFLIIATWIVVYVLTLLIRSYLVLPMIIPRYLLCVIPAVLLMSALGISYIRAAFTRGMIIVLIFAFSLTDLLAVKNYYNTITKPQYRENAEHINRNRSAAEPVVARVGWHYGHFIKDLHWMELDKYVGSIENENQTVKSFWYAAVHEDQPQLSKKSAQFLAENYTLSSTFNSYGVNAFHYTKKK